MPLIFASIGWANEVWWASPPDAASLAAVARALPDAAASDLDDLMSQGLKPADPVALQVLRTEFAAVRPMIQEFDGELQVMARLQKATADVHHLETPEDRALLWEALVFEGYAVHRYFQDKLGIDPAAAPYRVGAGDVALVAPWVDAVALGGGRTPDPSLVADAPQLLAFDAAQATARLMPSATFIFGSLAKGAEVRIDGTLYRDGSGTRVQIIPGRHLFQVRVGETVLLMGDARIPQGTDAVLTAPFGPEEMAALRALVATGTDGWSVPRPALAVLEGEPAYIAVPGGDDTRLWRVDEGSAVRIDIPRPVREAEGSPFSVLAGAGGGWLSTGDFLLQNAAAGAPPTRATVNAGTLGLHAGAELAVGSLVVGAGLDLNGALGEHHTLPTGESATGAFVYPHAVVGLRWAQFTAGPLFPWYMGLGGRGRVPVAGPIEVFAAGIYGLPLSLQRDDGPDFDPQPLFSAWGGVDVRFGP